MNEVVTQLNLTEILDIYRTTERTIIDHMASIEEALTRSHNAGVSNDQRLDAADFKRKAIASLRKQTWRKILNASGAEKILSLKRMKEFEHTVSGNGFGEIPEPTEQAIIDVLLGGGTHELFQEMVIEVSDYLRQGALACNKYVTNTRNARNSIGKKIILTRVFDVYTGCSLFGRMNERDRRYLLQVDKIFHLLDNKPFDYNAYTSPLVDGISNKDGQNNYFKWLRYQNGNVHLTFQRADLLKKLNQMIGSLSEPVLGD